MFRVIILVSVVASLVDGFPDGAPADTCVKSRFNQPHHGQAKSQPLETSPYQVVASTDVYHAGQQIELTISGHDVFRGFFFQARDANTNEWIGEFLPSANTKTIPECSSVTHADPKDKTQARLIWQAPKDKQGHVFFTGAVVKDYGTFWANIIAQVPAH
ncbi:putative defense protein 3 [Culicoides brevitarsis]|uniref:putative defense protein 3 n=1 Tax=Culicoides brevitarsis TaxID=469753 RepID=UPI00307B691E